MLKLDFGSGYNPMSSYKTCDMTGYSNLDYWFRDGRVNCEDKTFDIIRCRNVLHHIKDINNIVKEFFRILKKNGYLLLIDCKEKDYKKNFFLDLLWYRYLTFDNTIWFSNKYRDYFKFFNKKFNLINTKIINEKEVSVWKKLNNN